MPSLSPSESPSKSPSESPTELPSSSPTEQPTAHPTGHPTRQPTEQPTGQPTGQPTAQPTDFPTAQPTAYPTGPPTAQPTGQPTDFPTTQPTAYPTRLPTAQPTGQPTESPTDLQTYKCEFPDYYSEFAVITKENIYSAAHNVYTKLAAGTNVINPHSTSGVAVDGTVYYGGTFTGLWNKNGNPPQQQIDDLSDAGIDFAHYEWLAQNLKNSNINGKKVIVKTSGTRPGGGCWNLYDFRPSGQGEDNGITLVVFNTSDDICLTGTSDGRQFGPSVLAPFSKVSLRSGAGFIDGNVIARKFTTFKWPNSYGDNLQLHGDAYKGEVLCV